MNYTHFDKLFLQREVKVLRGAGYKNTIILVFILTLLFLGIGHSIGGLKTLKKRMDNPFTKWVNLPINQKNTDERDQVIKDAKSDKFMYYDIESISGYCRDFFTIMDSERIKSYAFLGRSIDTNDDLLKAIVDKKNLNFLCQKEINYTENEDWVIITKKGCEILGITSYQDLKHLNFLYEYSNHSFILQIPVLAVVEELPDLVELLVPERLHELYNLPTYQSNFINTSSTNQINVVSQKEINSNIIEGVYDIDYSEFDDNGQEAVINTIYFDNYYPIDTLLMKGKKIMNNLNPESSYILYDYELQEDQDINISSPHYLVFNFSDLKQVKSFRDLIMNDYGLEISMNQVEDKENFSIVVGLTSLLAVLLFIISLLAALLYTSNVLTNHLESIKPNLGTIKAFGLSNTKLISDYRKVILKFVTESLLISLLLISVYYCISYFFTFGFEIFHWIFLASIFLFYVLIYIYTNKILIKNLQKSPGDLIYNRQ